MRFTPPRNRDKYEGFISAFSWPPKMLRLIRDLLRLESDDVGFRHAGFVIQGQRKFEKAAHRALLLADAYGPTLQINFIRPLRHQRAIGDNCAWWALTEDSIRRHPSAADPAAIADQLRAVFKTFRPTIVIASRYGGSLAPVIIDLARRDHVPLLSHIDDNLLTVPPSSGDISHAKHGNQERQLVLRQLLAEADLNYISTKPLYTQLLEMGVLGKDVIVGGIAGAAEPLPVSHKTEKKRARESTCLTFGYMGSRSHTGDLEMIAPAIAAVLRRFPQARFETFGSVDLPAALSAFKIVRHGRMKDYDQFLRRLSSLDWSFGLAPLAVNDFTMAKTNIKWIEYSAAGIPVLASNHPIYHACCREGAGLLIDGDWQERIGEMIETPALRRSLLTQARQRLEMDYSPQRLHAQLMTVLQAAGAMSDRLSD
jgi:glycosyltransferase involved in cell wall biosynthesis